MKREKRTGKQVNRLEQLKSAVNLIQELDLYDLNKIRGGDGDDGGDEEIIIPLPTSTSNTGTNTSVNSGTSNNTGTNSN